MSQHSELGIHTWSKQRVEEILWLAHNEEKPEKSHTFADHTNYPSSNQYII